MKDRLTTDKRKIFARESLTLNSMTKDELRKHYNEIFDRLQEYEVAEEQGQLIRPPCKVGDEAYLVTPNGKIREINITDIYIEIKPTATVMRLSATFYVDNKPYFFQVSPLDFGKTIFLTREEAQAKLKGGAE